MNVISKVGQAAITGTVEVGAAGLLLYRMFLSLR